jgi:hypothetical protein
MQVRVAGNRGSTTLKFVGVSFLLLVALGGWLATWQHYHHNTAMPACTAANLHLSIGITDGTAGTQYTHVVLMNQGNNACVLSGYPAAFLTGASNNSLGGIAPSGAPHSVTLSSGKSAHVIVVFPDHEAFADAASCSPASANLELYAPGDTSPLSRPFVQYICPGTSVSSFSSGQ